MDNRHEQDQSELTLVTLPQDVIVYFFSFLDFQELAIVALVSRDFSQRASYQLLNMNAAWQANMKQQLPLYHDFLVSTRADQFIDWQMEYDSVQDEVKRKSKSGSVAKPNYSKEYIKALEGELDDASLFFAAIENGYADLVQYFYEKNQYTTETQTSNGIFILIWASKFGSLSVCQYLWELECVDLKKPQHERAYTKPLSDVKAGRALFELFEAGHIQLIKFCIQHDVERNMNYCVQMVIDEEDDDAEWVPSDDEDSIPPENAGKVLVSGFQGSVSSAELGVVNRSVYQTLVWCIEYNYLDILKCLLKKYPDPIYKNYALYAAAKKDNLAFVKYLLSRGASPTFIMPRDLQMGYLPHQVTPFEIAGFCNAHSVEQYLFLKLTLPDLKLDLNQIDEENNPKVLLNAMRYVLDIFDSNWSLHLTRKVNVCSQKRDAEGDVSVEEKEKFFHEKSHFSTWLQMLWKKLVQRTFDIYLSKIHDNEGIDKDGKKFLGFFSSKLQAIKNASAMANGANSISSILKINGLPEDIIEVLEMNEVFLEKCGIDSLEKRNKLFFGLAAEKYTDHFSDELSDDRVKYSLSFDPGVLDSDNSDVDQSDAEDHDDEEEAYFEQYTSLKPGRP